MKMFSVFTVDGSRIYSQHTAYSVMYKNTHDKVPLVRSHRRPSRCWYYSISVVRWLGGRTVARSCHWTLAIASIWDRTISQHREQQALCAVEQWKSTIRLPPAHTHTQGNLVIWSFRTCRASAKLSELGISFIFVRLRIAVVLSMKCVDVEPSLPPCLSVPYLDEFRLICTHTHTHAHCHYKTIFNVTMEFRFPYWRIFFDVHWHVRFADFSAMSPHTSK